MSGSALSEERHRYWQGWFEKWQAQGGTKKAFCAEHGLPLYSFYDWSRRLAAASPNSGGFAQVSCGESAGFRLRLGPGVVLELGADFDAATLRRLLSAVGSPC